MSGPGTFQFVDELITKRRVGPRQWEHLFQFRALYMRVHKGEEYRDGNGFQRSGDCRAGMCSEIRMITSPNDGHLATRLDTATTTLPNPSPRFMLFTDNVLLNAKMPFTAGRQIVLSLLHSAVYNFLQASNSANNHWQWCLVADAT